MFSLKNILKFQHTYLRNIKVLIGTKQTKILIRVIDAIEKPKKNC